MNSIRARRKAKNMTMKQLGHAVGVSESTISLYETGKHEPDIETLKRIASVLDTTVDGLLSPHWTQVEQKQSVTVDISQSLDKAIVDVLVRLTPEQTQRVLDFVAGMRASGTGSTSDQKSDS